MAYELDFEKNLAELDKKINNLQKKSERLKPGEQEELKKAQEDLSRLTKDIYDNLDDWQTVQVARHPDRPHALDYIRLMSDDFFELRGDRNFGDNATIVGGLATLGSQTVMFLCHEKGRSIKERQHHNAGQPHPEGFRKGQRLLQQAERFGFPVICLIDTPGASIALEDEERGQGSAIAYSLYKMALLRTPIISVVIGEGGSGGALALSVADRILMLKHSYYAVAAPESSAEIIWRSTKFAPQVAEGQQISSQRLVKLGLVDGVIEEPAGGAHRDYSSTAEKLKETLLYHLDILNGLTKDELIEQRYQKFRSIGPVSSTTLVF